MAFCLNLVLLMDSLLGSAVDLAVLRSVTVDGSSDPVDHFTAAGRAAICLKLAFAATALLAIAGAGEIPGWAVLKRSGGRALLGTAVTSGAGLLLFRSVLVRLQLRGRFDLLGGADLCHSTLRVALVLAVLASGVRDPLVLLSCYGAAALALFGTAGSMQGAFRRTEVPRALLSAIARKAAGIAQVFGVGAVMSRLDIFLLAFAANPRELGIYGAATALVLIPEMVAGYVSKVLARRARAGAPLIQEFRPLAPTHSPAVRF